MAAIANLSIQQGASFSSDVTVTTDVDGVVYKEEELTNYLKNIILARQEIQQSRIRHTIEIEKIDVLTNYYNDKIKEEIAKIKK